MNNSSANRTTVRIRGDMLVAWFSDATPPVLWRCPRRDLSGGFALRKDGGKTELVRNESDRAPEVIATFGSEQAAGRALTRLSDAMISASAFSGEGMPNGITAGRLVGWVSKAILVCMLLLFTYTSLRMLTFFSDPLGNMLQSTSTSTDGRIDPALVSRAAAALGGSPSAPPGQAVRPAAPAPAAPPSNGTPFDADSLLR